MKGAEQLISLDASFQDAGYSQNSLGMVSPCSTCRNLRAAGNGEAPACPRRFWQSQADAVAASDGSTNLTAPPEYLLRTAREADQAGYENPVAWPEGRSRVVWVAVLEENRPLLNANGLITQPDLLAPDFDTTNISCRLYPYVPGVREGDYYAGGQLREGDFVLAQSFSLPQMDADDPGHLTPLRIGGVVTKLTPMQKLTVTPAKRSVNPRGV